MLQSKAFTDFDVNFLKQLGDGHSVMVVNRLDHGPRWLSRDLTMAPFVGD